MSIGEVYPCSSVRTSSSRSLEYSPSPERRQELLNNLAAIGSARSYDTQTASVIAVALKAHEKMLMDPFVYALNHLVKQNDHKVVVICCMSRIRSELGVDLLIDETVSGISKKKLESTMIAQKNNMNHFLRAFRDRLDEKGVLLEIHIYLGRRSDDILVKAATELHPHWIVLDNSFSGHQNKIQAALKCDLVLMKKKKDSKPVILQLTPKVQELGPVDQIHDEVSEEVVNPILGTSSPTMRITPYISTDLTSRQNGAFPTRGTEAPLRGPDTGDTATSSTNIKTDDGYPAPPVLSPAQLATPPIHTPLHTERSTESGRPVPSTLSWVATQSRLALRRSPSASPTHATKSLPASMHLSGPRLSVHTIATPPNPPSSTSRSKPASQTSSTSQASTTKANPSISRPLIEPIPYEVSLVMARNASPQPTCTSKSKPGTPTSSSSPAWAREANPSISSPQSEPIPYETALAMAINASLLPNPPKSATRSMASTPAVSSSRTWTGEANPSIKSPLSEPIPYETALAMAMSASLLTAEEEGIPVSDRIVPNAIAPAIALNPSILSDSEEDVPLIRRGCSNHVSGAGASLSSSPLPENVSSCDGGQLGHRGPADRNNTDTDEFGGWHEGEHSSNSNWGPASSAGARTSIPGLSVADVPSPRESSESGIPRPTRSPTSVFGFSSHQSLTQVASPSAQHAPSAPPLPSDGPIRYPNVDTSSVHYPPEGSSENPPTKKKANARRDGECVICWDRPADAVCIPCGHVAGCKNCLTEIKSNKWRCPVCRVTIQQVLKIYVV